MEVLSWLVPLAVLSSKSLCVDIGVQGLHQEQNRFSTFVEIRGLSWFCWQVATGQFVCVIGRVVPWFVSVQIGAAEADRATCPRSEGRMCCFGFEEELDIQLCLPGEAKVSLVSPKSNQKKNPVSKARLRLVGINHLSRYFLGLCVFNKDWARRLEEERQKVCGSVVLWQRGQTGFLIRLGLGGQISNGF